MCVSAFDATSMLLDSPFQGAESQKDKFSRKIAPLVAISCCSCTLCLGFGCKMKYMNRKIFQKGSEIYFCIFRCETCSLCALQTTQRTNARIKPKTLRYAGLALSAVKIAAIYTSLTCSSRFLLKCSRALERREDKINSHCFGYT